MTTKYGSILGTQNAPITTQVKETQVKNSAGGYVFAAGRDALLRRFLIIGTEASSAYASSYDLTKENVTNLLKCIQEDGPGTVRAIVEVRKSGAAYRPDACILALLYAMKKGDLDTRRLATLHFSDVVVTGSDILMALDLLYALEFGMGRMTRRAFSSWYTSKTPDNLAYQVMKYQNRHNQSHKSVWAACHGKPTAEIEPIVTRFKSGFNDVLEADDKKFVPQLIKDVVNLRRSVNDIDAVTFLIDSNRSITWEMVPNEISNNHSIQKALLKNMPLNAMVRNLGKYTASGLLDAHPEVIKTIVDRLSDADYVKRSKIHPFRLYVAAKQYGMGKGDKGSLVWMPNHRIIDALEKAFESAMTHNIEVDDTKTFVIGVDISGSMTALTPVANISAREAAIVMSFILARQFPNSHVVPFHERTFEPVRALGRSLSDYVQTFRRDPQGTNCGALFEYASKMRTAPDGVICLTDSETWKGHHPFRLMKEMRKSSGKPIKSVLVPLVANRLSINDPDDGFAYEIVGFDSGMMSMLDNIIRL